jgi:sialic acid synthase SpsE
MIKALEMTEIVAEISGNHGGKLTNAHRLIAAAANAGADAVKFQCFDPERLAARRAARADVLALAGGIPLIDLYRQIWTPWDWFPVMADLAESFGLKWFSSVFDPADVAFLETLDCPRYKISAFEMLDWDIIKAVRETCKPIVMSVRPIPGLTILRATTYDGFVPSLGLSAHGNIMPAAHAPMVEWHLKLEDVETPDSAFSLTPAEMRSLIERVKKQP